MIEKHPFGDFVPDNAKYLMIGSFPAKPSDSYGWFYANGRNQFWLIMEGVYGNHFDTKAKQQQLFVDLEMALTDIILACARKNNSNLDINLSIIEYNTLGITSIITENPIQKIFFTSKFVESLYKKLFKEFDIELISLPSPSPRYAMMTKQEKIQRYKELLPKLSI